MGRSRENDRRREEEWGRRRDPDDTHYSEKTGHERRGLCARLGLKPRTRFIQDPDNDGAN